MPYLNLTINCPDVQINDLNAMAERPTLNREGIQGCIDVLNRVLAGTWEGEVVATTRDTDPAVAEHGTGSQQNTYNKL